MRSSMTRFFTRRLRAGLAAVVVGLLAGVVRADEATVDKLNKKIDNFTLTDAQGKTFSLYDLKDRKAVVVVFLSFECPVSNSYAPVLAELAKSYGGRKVAFVGVDSSDEGGAAQGARQAAAVKIPFPQVG